MIGKQRKIKNIFKICVLDRNILILKIFQRANKFLFVVFRDRSLDENFLHARR